MNLVKSEVGLNTVFRSSVESIFSALKIAHDPFNLTVGTSGKIVDTVFEVDKDTVFATFNFATQIAVTILSIESRFITRKTRNKPLWTRNPAFKSFQVI